MLDVYNKAYPGAHRRTCPAWRRSAARRPPRSRRARPAKWPRSASSSREASVALNSDVRLAASMKKAGNVLVPMAFEQVSYAPPPGQARQAAARVRREEHHRRRSPARGGQFLLRPRRARCRSSRSARRVAGIGHLNSSLDEDGAIRFEPLVIDYYGQQYPVAVADARGEEPQPHLQGREGERWARASRSAARPSAPTTPAQMYTYFYKDRDGRPAFPIDSFFDVYSGKIPAVEVRRQDRADRRHRRRRRREPGDADLGADEPGARRSRTRSPRSCRSTSSWRRRGAPMATLGAYLADRALHHPAAAAPGRRHGRGSHARAARSRSSRAHLGLMTSAGLWIQLMLPAHAAAGRPRAAHHQALPRHRARQGEGRHRGRGIQPHARPRVPAAGPARHGVRQVPQVRRSTSEVMENIYSLALDFERRRQFNKAESCFRYMATYNPKFSDIEERMQPRQAAVARPSSSAAPRRRAPTRAPWCCRAAAQEKPMLGRYQVEKELGKGAMGVVYGGKDPKIGRVVAIKTMALSAEFEADELVEAKERFFREAETAGRLNHPNIVTIYDAGEEHDLCYIAMEFLKGKDLVPYTKQPEPAARPTRCSRSSSASPMRWATRTRMGVVHRDIKPANIMYEPESDTREGHRLRHRAHHRLVQDQDRHGAGHAVVHVARAARRQEDRRAQRPLLARRHALPDALRAAAVRGRVDDAAHVRHRQHAAPARSATYNPALPDVDGADHRQGARQGPREALPDRRRVRRGDPRGAQGRSGASSRRCRASGADGPARAAAPPHDRDPGLQARGRPLRHRGPPRRHASRTTSSSPRACARRASRSTACGCASPSTATLTIVDAAAAMDAMPYVERLRPRSCPHTASSWASRSAPATTSA